MRKISLVLALLVLAMLAFLFSGCNLYPGASEWKRCDFEIASVKFLGFQEDQTQWELVLKVHNPNSDRLQMEGVQLFALQGEDTLATLRNSRPLDLAPDTTTIVTLNAESAPSAWNTVFENLKRNGTCSITVTGDAFYHGTFGTEKLSGLFRKTYTVDFATALNAMGSHLLQGFQGFPLH